MGNKTKVKINWLELLCRFLISVSVVIIAGMYLNSFKIDSTIEILFNILLVGVVMNWGIDISTKPLW